MIDYKKYVSRHGEFGAQALVERLERYEGVRSHFSASLEERWDALMGERASFEPCAAV